ncbi:acetate/propionate family kinase [Micropruina sp.]|uniref:acetate/propionate family kinase n=1 Tax=Micropruina sp. TaxID=2737536 RepID=UPI0039E21CC3
MSTPILLLNAGSSSIKYQVIDADDESVLASGLVQRIGDESGTIDHTVNGQTFHQERGFPNHGRALTVMVQLFEQHGPALSSVVAVGHRTVHGGAQFRETTLVTDEMLDALRELSPLAPLHNPPAIAGIDAARKALPDVPHVAVFDTAFFSTLPAPAYTYAVARDVAQQHGIRRYGFHGTSHSYVSKKVAEVLGRPYEELNQIVCHLGNGASISAIRGGVAVDTSMGLTPLEGLVMGTRSGDVDPGLHAYLARQVGMSIDDIDTLLNKKSGMLGLCGATDFRDINDLIADGDPDATLALEVYVHRMLHYIGAYLAVLGSLDAITFTAGVGENNPVLRKAIIDRLAGFGFSLDDDANAVRSKEPRVISTPDSKVTVLVVPTNEELAMARETKAAVGA